MADPNINVLIAAFSSAWNQLSSSILGAESELNLLDAEELSEGEIPAALSVAQEFSSAYSAQCTGKMKGAVLLLFKTMDRVDLEQLAKATDISNQEGCGALINAALGVTAENLGPEVGGKIKFSPAQFLDLYGEDNPALRQLAASMSGPLYAHTFTLTVGDSIQSQIKLFFTPPGKAVSVPPPSPVTQAVFDAAAEKVAAASAATIGMVYPNTTSRNVSPEEASRNIERLLEVELEVVVRFGKTQMNLRDLVRVGVGSMIELNRQVDDPVELLVNNHPLARGTVVVVDGYYGVRITEIGKPEERRLSLTKA